MEDNSSFLEYKILVIQFLIDPTRDIVYKTLEDLNPVKRQFFSIDAQ